MHNKTVLYIVQDFEIEENFEHSKDCLVTYDTCETTTFTSDICINLHIFVHGMEQLYLLCSTYIKKLIQNVYNSYY